MEALIRYIKTLKPEYAAAAALIYQGRGMRFEIQFIRNLPYEADSPDWFRALWNSDPEQEVMAFGVAYEDLMATLKEVENGIDNEPAKDG